MPLKKWKRMIRVNLSQHTGPFAKGIANTERFAGAIANYS